MSGLEGAAAGPLGAAIYLVIRARWHPAEKLWRWVARLSAGGATKP